MIGPNVVVVVVDTLRADHVHGYGYPRETTPFLDRVMAEGVRFDAAIAESSWSAPSHASIITGTHAAKHGVLDFGMELAPGISPLAVHLKQRGYRTGLYSTHLAFHRSVRGITEGLDWKLILENAKDRYLVDRALKWAGEQADPFFLYMCLMTPHAPYDKYPPEYDERYFAKLPEGGERTYPFGDLAWSGDGEIPTSVRIDDIHEVGEYVNRYDRGVRYADELLGGFWQGIEELGIGENTILVVTSDHGEGLGDHDFFAHERYLYDFLVRVPMMIRAPGLVPAGQTWKRPVAHVDIAPTLLGLVGAPQPAGLDGRNLSRWLVRGREPSLAETPEQPALSFYNHRGYERYMVRSRTHKLVLDASEGREELYDLAADPTEARDLAGSTGADAIAAPLRTYMSDLVTSLRAVAVGVAVEEAELDPDVEAELRALGYIEH